MAKETSALDFIPGTGKIMLLLQSVQRHRGAWPVFCPVGGVKCTKPNSCHYLWPRLTREVVTTLL